jgi:hypothetical protein
MAKRKQTIQRAARKRKAAQRARADEKVRRNQEDLAAESTASSKSKTKKA